MLDSDSENDYTSDLSDSDESSTDTNMDQSDDSKMWTLITEMNKKASDTTAPTPVGNLIQFLSKDIYVKVGTVIYELHRVKLALKSDYFETLFTANFQDKDAEFVELYTIDEDTFSDILDIIYGTELKMILKIDNYADLLLAMDYLQMEIDLKIFRDFIMEENLKTPLCEFKNVYKLINSIAGNVNFEYLLSAVHQYLSIHLMEAIDCEEFPSLMLPQLVEVIRKNQFPQYDEEKRQIGRICAKWIYEDVEDRLPYVTELVNAAMYRYDCPFKICSESFNLQCLNNTGDGLMQEVVGSYFHDLLNRYGEIDTAKEESTDTNEESNPVLKTKPENMIINKIDEKEKWSRFLENEDFYDITVKAGSKTYKLHRYKLNPSSEYFARLPSNPAPHKDEEYSFNDIDQTTFDAIIKYIYFEEEIVSTSDTVFGLLKAGHVLKMPNLLTRCRSHIVNHMKEISQDLMEILNFTFGQKDYEEEFETLRSVIVDQWSRINTMTSFFSISCDCLINILRLPKLRINDADELVDICSKWIIDDLANRYSCMGRIVAAINCNHNSVRDLEDLKVESDFSTVSLSAVRDKFKIMLYSSTMISTSPSSDIPMKSWVLEEQQMFISVYDDTLDILDSSMNTIASICSLKSNNPARTKNTRDCLPSSAAIVNDNVFILCQFKGQYRFIVYNMVSKKFFYLASDPLMSRDVAGTLLNCKDQVFCCFKDGCILKYSTELNRWTVFAVNDPARQKVAHFSDGRALYKVFRSSADYGALMYDFEKSKWIRLPDLGLLSYSGPLAHQVTICGDLVVVFRTAILLFDPESQLWSQLTMPSGINASEIVSVFTQYEDDVLYVTTLQQIYCVYASTGRCIVVGQLPALVDKKRSFYTVHTVNKCQEDVESMARLNNVIIHGIQHVKGESTNDLVLSLATKAGIRLTIDDIDSSYRSSSFSTANDRPSTIVVKFKSTERRNEFFNACRKAQLSSKVFGFKDKKKIHVYDHLTKRTAGLLRKAKKLKVQYRFHYVGIRDGRIIAQEDKNGREIFIDSEADIDNAIPRCYMKFGNRMF